MSVAKDDSKDIISSINYEDSNPVYQKIKKRFTNKLKDKYECEDYEGIVKYVFDYVFKKKSPKASCVENLNSIFNDKASEIMDFLWKITKEAEKEQEPNDSDDDSGQGSAERFGNRGPNRRGPRNARNLRNNEKRIGSEKARKNSKDGKYFNKSKRDRSRSKSRENKYDYDLYPNYPPQPKGFYPPKGRFARPMMPVGGPYPPYYPPQMINPYIQR